MLVKFAIDPEALGCAESDAFYRFYRNWWPSYGVLADPRGSGSVLTCKSKYLDELQTAYKYFQDNGWPLFCETRPIDWRSMQSPSDLAKYSDEFSLALLEDTRALVFGVPDGDGGKFCKNFGGVHATRFHHADLAEISESAKDMSKQTIRIGQNTAALWNKRFQNLVRCSNGNQQITIVDRYVGANIYRKHNDLFRVLENINADSPGCSVTVFSSNRDVTNSADVKERINSNLDRIGLRKNGIKHLTMHICYDDVFRKSAHDRYMRFSVRRRKCPKVRHFDGFVCIIGIGIEIFRANDVETVSELFLKSLDHPEYRKSNNKYSEDIKVYLDREDELRNGKHSTWTWKA